MAWKPSRWGATSSVVENFGIDPFDLDLDAVGHAAVGQGFGDGFIGILKLGVFADDGDLHFALGVVNPVVDVMPDVRSGLGAGRCRRHPGRPDPALARDRPAGPRRWISDHRRRQRFFAHVAEQGDLLALFFGDRMFGAADQDVGRDADGLQFFDGVLGRLGLQLAAGCQIGQQGQVHENALAARFVMGKLADRFKEGQAFDVAHGAADFAEHEIDFVFANRQEIFDFVGDMRDNLNGFAQIIAAALFFQHGGIDPARGDGIGLARGTPVKRS